MNSPRKKILNYKATFLNKLETLLTTCAQPDESFLLIQTSPIMTHSCEGGREFLKAPAKQCIYNNMCYVE